MKKPILSALVILCAVLAFGEKPIVQDIQAMPSANSRINVFWTLPDSPDETITSLRLYRSTRQITSYSQISDLSPIATLAPDLTGYTDSVTDQSDYFYAVIAVTDRPYDLILPAFNSTVSGARAASETKRKSSAKAKTEKTYPDGAMRETPLPYINLENQPDKAIRISETAVSATNSLSRQGRRKNPAMTPYVFEEDLISPDGGDDYLLFEILKNYFVQRNYEETIRQIQKLTGTNINQATRNRAFFYLGESEYFLGDYESAVRTFVKVEQEYPVLVKKWLDSALDRL